MSESMELLALQITIDKAKVETCLTRREQEMHKSKNFLAIHQDQNKEIEALKSNGASYKQLESLEHQARKTWGWHTQAEQKAEIALEEAEAAIKHAEWAVKIYHEDM